MNRIEQGCECCWHGEYQAAIAHFNHAIQEDPACAAAWNYRGNAWSGLKRSAEALRDYDQAVFLKPDYHQAWFNRGVLLTEMGAYGNAIASYDRALQYQADPVYLHARAAIGLKQTFIFV